MTVIKTNSIARPIFILGIFLSNASLLMVNARAETAPFTCELGQTVVKGDTPDGTGIWCEVGNEKEGLYQVSYPSGKLKIESHFKKDKQDGSYRMISESGQTLKEGAFSNGKMNGIWKRYHSNGNLRDEGNWVQGEPEGSWYFFHADGKLKEQVEYENGKVRVEDPGPLRPSLSLLNFSLELVAASQGTGGRSQSPVVGYQPRGKLGKRFDWVSGISFTGFASRSGGMTFIPIMDLSAGARYYLPWQNFLFLEIRAGFQSWLKVDTFFSPELKLGFNPHWKNSLFYVAFQGNNNTDQWRFGLEMNFGAKQ